MAWKQPVVTERVQAEIADIVQECREGGSDLTERLALEIRLARDALAHWQNNKTYSHGSAEAYVIELHTARIAAFELEILKHAEPLRA